MTNNAYFNSECHPHNVQKIVRLSDSLYSEKIRKDLIQRTPNEIAIACLFYLNITAYLAVALSALGMGIHATVIYIISAYIIIALGTTIEYLSSRRILKTSKTIFLSGVLEDSSISIALLINALSDQQAYPAFTTLSICAMVFISLVVTTRPLSVFIISKTLLFLFCVVYAVIFVDELSKSVIILFPLIISFILILATGYWLYIRQVRFYHQKHEQEYLQNTIRKKNLDLENLLTEERRIRKELENAHTLREKIIAHVSHDLRQPISALNYSLFNIDIDSRNRIQKEQLDLAQKSVISANYLIEEILQISTYKKKDIVVNLEMFNTYDLLLIIKREFSVPAQQAACSLRVVACNTTIYSDPHLIGRILRNFLSNAIRYAEGSKILLGVRRRVKYIEFQVLDQGPGIPLAIKDKVFDEFIQGENATNPNGFGLGLNIAKDLAHICDADVYIKSVPNKGTLCALKIPITG